MYPGDLFYSEWSLYSLILTLPVSAISFGYRFMENDVLYPVFLIQLIMFALLFLILRKFTTNKSKN